MRLDGGNWARQRQDADRGRRYDCVAAHTEPLNGNLKAYAAWHLFARLAGWNPGITQAPGAIAPPTDTDGDGVYDDVNGNGRRDFADVVLYLNQMSRIAANEPIAAFDCNANGRVDFADVVWPLFSALTGRRSLGPPPNLFIPHGRWGGV